MGSLLLPWTLCSSCAVYRSTTPVQPVAIPEQFVGDHHEGLVVDRWWTTFNDDGLTSLINNVISNNFSLRQSWARLQQAQAFAIQAGADRIPQGNVEFSAARNRAQEQGSEASGAKSTRTVSDYMIATVLSYEVDLWRRIASQQESATLNQAAARQDVEAAALALAGQAASLWFTWKEQAALKALLLRQVAASKKQLALIELRFGLGQASALDVYQQGEQVAATLAQLPPVLSLQSTTEYQLQILQGVVPGGEDNLNGSPRSAVLPALPALGVPMALLQHRPDVHAAWLRLQAADRDVASAVADRFPRLSLSLSYGFRADAIGDLVDRETANIVGNLLSPWLDGGRRRAEVTRRKAVALERLEVFQNTLLGALGDVESALVREKHQKILVDRLSVQKRMGQRTLDEAQSRYLHGLNDYLSVLNALVSLQRVERLLLSADAQLFRNRVDLHRALGGGAWTTQLVDPSSYGDRLKQTEDGS